MSRVVINPTDFPHGVTCARCQVVIPNGHQAAGVLSDESVMQIETETTDEFGGEIIPAYVLRCLACEDELREEAEL